MVGTAVAICETVTNLPTDQVELIQRATDYAAGAKADSTRRAYPRPAPT